MRIWRTRQTTNRLFLNSINGNFREDTSQINYNTSQSPKKPKPVLKEKMLLKTQLMNKLRKLLGTEKKRNENLRVGAKNLVRINKFFMIKKRNDKN